jgi:hypothetical protein
MHSVDRPILRAHYASSDDPVDSDTLGRALAASLVPEYGQYMVLEESQSFYNWLADMTAIEGRYAWLWEGIQFDVENNVLWPPSWGTKPASIEAQKARVRELVESAPRLIPVFQHRYLLSEPYVAGNPVLSAWQSDIIVYGANLRDYLLVEFADLLGLDEAGVRMVQKTTAAHINDRFNQFCAIPFWGEFL